MCPGKNCAKVNQLISTYVSITVLRVLCTDTNTCIYWPMYKQFTSMYVTSGTMIKIKNKKMKTISTQDYFHGIFNHHK